MAKSKRRELDAYYTPDARSAVSVLVARQGIRGVIMEPCAGEGGLSEYLPGRVITNDINPRVHADHYVDASTPDGWAGLPSADWIITNPPFSLAPKIVPLAFEHARVGVAMLLRLTFAEPCANRVGFLTGQPLSALYVLPRVSFTGDGKTDSVTCAWFVWRKDRQGQEIHIVSHVELQDAKMFGGHSHPPLF